MCQGGGCRIVDIFLSSASQTAGVDVWFVLLDRPQLDSRADLPPGAAAEPQLQQALAKVL